MSWIQLHTFFALLTTRKGERLFSSKGYLNNVTELGSQHGYTLTHKSMVYLFRKALEIYLIMIRNLLNHCVDTKIC